MTVPKSLDLAVASFADRDAAGSIELADSVVLAGLVVEVSIVLAAESVVTVYVAVTVAAVTDDSAARRLASSPGMNACPVVLSVKVVPQQEEVPVVSPQHMVSL